MNKQTRRLAVSGMMVALATAVLLMGGVIPAATFVSPALAGIIMIPVLVEGGRRMALGAWLAVSALGLMLSADKEAALLFAFLGWYPAMKWTLDARLPGWRGLPVKLLLWNACAGAMLAVFILLANVTLVLYDRLLNIMAVVYVRKLRPKLFKG